MSKKAPAAKTEAPAKELGKVANPKDVAAAEKAKADQAAKDKAAAEAKAKAKADAKAAKDAEKAKAAAAKKAEREAKAAARAEEGAKTTDALKEAAKRFTKDKEHKTAGGNASVHCNDDVAIKLLGKTLDECYGIAAKIAEMPEEDLRKKYAHLNLGMQRMNLGNKMRGVLHAK
jgi:colicin import membrane protein